MCGYLAAFHVVAEVMQLDVKVFGSGTDFGDSSDLDGAAVILKNLATDLGTDVPNNKAILFEFSH
jgi:hypothetical protein